MKYLKRFEDINIDEPKVGDYVITFDNCDYGSKYNDYLDFVNNSIGKLYTIKNEYSDNYRVIFYNVPESIVQWFTTNHYDEKYLVVDREEILYWSKNKEELEHILAAKKYNL